jgi:hypothetical protein
VQHKTRIKKIGMNQGKAKPQRRNENQLFGAKIETELEISR